MKSSPLQKTGFAAALAMAGLLVTTIPIHAGAPANATCSIQCYSAEGDFADMVVTLLGVPDGFSCSGFADEMGSATGLTCYGNGSVYARRLAPACGVDRPKEELRASNEERALDSQTALVNIEDSESLARWVRESLRKGPAEAPSKTCAPAALAVNLTP